MDDERRAYWVEAYNLLHPVREYANIERSLHLLILSPCSSYQVRKYIPYTQKYHAQCMTTATWSSMYLLISPKKHDAIILITPNAILVRYTHR